MRICVRGPLLSISGYGNHTRQVFRWLNQKEGVQLSTQILPWGITPWLINPDDLNGLVGEIMKRSVEFEATGFDLSFQVQLPNEWDPKLAKFNVGVTAAVETDLCNPEWITKCNEMNLIVVPSNHTKTTLERTGTLTVPIVVVPESFPDSILNDELEPYDLNVRTKFNFLIFGQITGSNAFVDRKNTFFALKWLTEAFAGDPDVGVVIKTNHGRNTSIDRRVCKNLIRKVVRELNTDVPVYLVHGAMSEDEVASFYRNKTVKCLIAPTRGEGYGLPLLEAAASGLPVIATNWSGHRDFLDKGKWISLDYRLEEVPQEKIDNNIFVKGAKWAEVDENDFKKKVKKFRDQNQKPVEWAQQLSTTLKSSHSFESISKLWDEVAKEFIR